MRPEPSFAHQTCIVCTTCFSKSLNRSMRVLSTVLALLAATVSVEAFAPANLKPVRPSLFAQRSDSIDGIQAMKNLAVSAAVAFILVSSPSASLADGQTKDFKLPPIDYADKNRCVLNSSSMGQANAARDKLLDLRECKIAGAKATGYDLSGVIMTNTDASNANFAEAYFSKGYLRDSMLDGADFTNAIVDRATFKGSSLRGAIFANAVLTGTGFEGADVENADFTDAYIGDFDIRLLCKNPTLKGENPKTGADTRMSANCK
jgi:uncharacterized protein YjbI with pentapeptide repeats